MPPDSGKQSPREQKFDSGSSAEPSHQAMLEYFDRKTFYPIPLEEMHERICKAYRWEHWSEDPWGDLYRFNEWLGTTKDNELAIWAVNDTAGGRFYLARSIIRYVLGQEDYSKWSPEDLFYTIGLGAMNWVLVKAYSGWEGFKYPQEPLPIRFVNKEIIKVYTKHRFMMYRQMITSIYLWSFAIEEMTSRTAEHPELEGLLEIATDTIPNWLESTRLITPKGYPLPDKEKGYKKLEEAMRESLKKLSRKYRDIFPGGSYGEALPSLLKGAEYWKKKEFEFIKAGLEGKLLPSLLTIAKHDLIDATRKEILHRKREITESRIDAKRKAEGKEVDTPFLDTVPSPESVRQDIEAEEQREYVQQRFDQAGLTKMERLVAELRIEGCDYEYIADRISQAQNKQINATTVRKHWSNAKTKLAKILNK